MALCWKNIRAKSVTTPVLVLRGVIIQEFNFDPQAENVRDAVTQLCLDHTFHPIRQFLDGLIWDGVPRVDRWLISYMGAEDTPLNEAIGRIMLIGCGKTCSRARRQI